MRRMASPSALSRTLSLQRANARAKSSSRAESSSDQPSQLSKRIDLLFPSIPSSNTGLASRNALDTDQSIIPLVEPSKQLDNLLQVDDGNLHNAMKRCFSADVSSGCKACFPSWSQRIERGVDLWDRDFSSMSSYASDQHDGFLCGLRTRLNSDSSALCESAKGSKEDACSKSSWSEDSLMDTIQRDDGETPIAYRFEGLGIGCTNQRPPCVAYPNAQCGVGGSLRVLEKHNMLMPEYSATNERAKIDCEASTAGGLDEYLSRRGGYSAQCLQVGGAGSHRPHDASARDGHEETRAATSEGDSSTTTGGSSIPEEYGEGEVRTSSEKDGNNIDRLRVRCKRDYDRLEKEIMVSSERGEGGSIGVKSLKTLPADSVAVEMVSVNVVEDFRESMYEMMLEKNMEEECEDSSMQDLLNCYLLLNPSQLHNIIREVFSDVWIDIIMTLR